MKAELGPAKLETTKADYDALEKVSKVGILQIISDQFGYWRQCNLMRISKKFKEKCEKDGINPKQVSPKFLAQFIEAASLDEDADIQDMWAGLLAREARDPGVISLRTISSLKALSKEEAVAFQDLYGSAIRIGNEVAIYNDRNGDSNSIDDIIKLVDCGLIVSENTTITVTLTLPPKKSSVIAISPASSYAVVAKNENSQEEKCRLPVFSLTRAGQDILNATISRDVDNRYLAVAKKIKDRNTNTNLTIKLFKLNSADLKSGMISVDHDNDLLN